MSATTNEPRARTDSHFYQEERGQGFQFAYQIPGMNKVLQAAGRVIRDAQDKGFVLLLDERFELPSVQRFFPPHWLAHRKANTNEQLIQQVKQFWLKIKKTKEETNEDHFSPSYRWDHFHVESSRRKCCPE